MHQWKKVHTGYSKGPSGRARKIYKYVSDDGKLEIFSTAEHPTMKFAHQKKQIYWKVFDLVNQQPYGPSQRNLEDAFVAAEKWYKYIDVKEGIMFDKLLEKCLDEVDTESEKYQYFIDRTNNHIQLVQDAAAKIVKDYPEFDKLLEQVEVHDASKLEEPEKTPYIEITWRHKLEKEKGEFDPYNGKGYQTPGELEKEEENKVTLRHIRGNSHHPEYWAFGGDGYKDE